MGGGWDHLTRKRYSTNDGVGCLGELFFGWIAIMLIMGIIAGIIELIKWWTA